MGERIARVVCRTIERGPLKLLAVEQAKPIADMCRQAEVQDAGGASRGWTPRCTGLGRIHGGVNEQRGVGGSQNRIKVDSADGRGRCDRRIDIVTVRIHGRIHRGAHEPGVAGCVHGVRREHAGYGPLSAVDYVDRGAYQACRRAVEFVPRAIPPGVGLNNKPPVWQCGVGLAYGGSEAPAFIRVSATCDEALPQVGKADARPAGLTGSSKGGKQERHQNRDDRDDHQQLDQREGRPLRGRSSGNNWNRMG